ncbi:MAG: SagB/ThcOx family dehydrogenase [Candidatus Bipolaricaulota bacterium]|nr:SagB/ThcOx family dehydrogenase [Candidatus Bipolaricaulota bacterium]MDW8126661.1 SagB/ThcOx family dehydrogenase [Candidatus Bipolaricaulota bacterium]
METDQKRGIPAPPLQQPVPEGAELLDLPAPGALELAPQDLFQIFANRRSRRRFAPSSLALPEISFLLWATQGVQRVIRDGIATLRTVPSAGARHPLETYLSVHRVQGLTSGLYRYLPLVHKLCFLRRDETLPQKMTEAALGQTFVGEAAVVFVWTAVPYRTEWRYHVLSHKVIAIDAGHVCQNLYLACEALGLATCAVAAYDQTKMDELLGVDGEEEFTLYLAPVGRRAD